MYIRNYKEKKKMAFVRQRGQLLAIGYMFGPALTKQVLFHDKIDSPSESV